MQDDSRRSNKDRSDGTRAALVAAARGLFAARGFAGVGTPEIVAAAGVSRGALYHHFTDKEALFAAVVGAEMAAVAAVIRAGTEGCATALEALVTGGEAYLAAMAEPGRVALLLVDAPAVLGPAVLAAMDAEQGGQTLREGLAAAVAAGEMRALPVGVMADLLSAAYDRAALGISLGGDAGEWRAALRQVIGGLQAA
ncbi:TetR/AcrR family transcriptional regulator [Fertoebacter nigrum]|uniref:TetR/AcrR family transcriptional regulator n=1 Tax=Fertoeibacter niger TaxID=2656921 RepID=A0A8X8H246_9RHOB|nr:TetR/AcrR family transcriptional regulator [Fertoeibacter niger]NUB44792.1 TetR/AcrR family transcriptional regulator [Fertoeibacter niger]